MVRSLRGFVVDTGFVALAVGLAAASMAACHFDSDGVPGGANDEPPGDAEPTFPDGGDPGSPPPEAVKTCFYGPDVATPLAVVEAGLETLAGASAVHVRLTLDRAFVDNSYGKNAVGWPAGRMGGHQLADLVRSDRAPLTLSDGAGAVVFDLALDYLSPDPTAPSGYRSLGVAGGEGALRLGAAADVLAVSTSLDRNLNERGYRQFMVDSPPTDATYAPPATAPAWDFRVVYEVWLRAEAFGPAGFGSARIGAVHASPSKPGETTVPVVPGPCPPEPTSAAAARAAASR